MPNIANIVRFLRTSSFLTTSRVLIYASISTAAVTAVITHAFANHNNFYSASVYLSRSSRSALILANFALLLTLLVGRIMQQIFFGHLRPLEQERLYDRLWFFLTESLLAFTIFRDEFDVIFGMMFSFLLFVKCFHWLMADRIEWMDQIPYPGAGTLFKIRFLALFSILSLVDVIMLATAIESIMVHGVGAVVLFGNEYAIMLSNCFNCFAKYVVYTYDQRRAQRNGGENAPVWEQKSMYIFYIELVTDFLKLVTYLVFFLLVLTFYGLPLNIVRDVYLTARSFYQRCRDLIRYLNATKNMDQRYPNATQVELDEMSDKTCIICREELTLQSDGANHGRSRDQGPNMSPKKLLCGHIFHFHCLRSWLERQQSCPTCRRSVLDPGEVSQANSAQPQPQAPPNNEAAPRVVVNRDGTAPAPTTTRPDVATSSSTAEQRPQQRLRRHRWANELPGFQAGPLRPPLQFEGFEVGPGDWQSWVAAPRPTESELSAGNGHLDSLEASAPSLLDTTESTPSNPREAAALAALRRTSNGCIPQATDRTNLQRTSPSSSNVDASMPSQNRSLDDKGKGVSVSPLSEQRLASQARSRELGIPSMIPLYDPSLRAHTMDSNPALHPTRTSPSAPAMTRDFIDERLRALNEIQNALWKSAEELLKLKSLLPVSTPSFEHSSSFSPIETTCKTEQMNVDQGRETESESYPSEDD